MGRNVGDDFQDVDLDQLSWSREPVAVPARKRRAAQATVRVCACLLAILVVGSTGYAWQVTHALAERVQTLPAGALDTLQERPAPPSPAASGRTALSVLLLGSDRRLGRDVGGGVTGERADAILLIRLAADRDRVDVLSLPGDSWVDLPGTGGMKLNATLGGGVPQTVQAVETLTNIRVDHAMLIDFAGIRDLTAELGGVTVVNQEASTDPLTRTRFEAGPIVLKGDRALTFVRQIYGLADGEQGRIERQQQFLAVVGAQLRSAGVAGDPAQLRRVAEIFADNTTVDAGLTVDVLGQLLLDLVSTPSGAIRFFVAPSTGTGRTADGQSFVQLDKALLAKACTALNTDQQVPLPVSTTPPS